MRPLSILVYPHAMEIGGSQLNAVEIAAAVRDRGHEVIVYSEDGPLVDRVEKLGLRHVVAARTRTRPNPVRSWELGRLARAEGIEVLHGYEWPPILECFAAAGLRTSAVSVGTVMSMAVAPFLPRSLPLVVGTERIRESCEPRTGEVLVIEPPVDTVANRPGVRVSEETALPLPPGTIRLVIVSRLVKELKLEGILTTIRAVARLAERWPVHLTVVGDGHERAAVAAAAADVNQGRQTPVVTLTGELPDPRAVYDAADICVGMGGSALRSLAFAKPLVVQGEGGFFAPFEPATADVFARQGFYGTAALDHKAAVAGLVDLLEPLLAMPERRRDLGLWGRQLVVDRYSLERAAGLQEACYGRARAAARRRTARDSLVTAAQLTAFKADRARQRVMGSQATDDFNARPV